MQKITVIGYTIKVLSSLTLLTICALCDIPVWVKILGIFMGLIALTWAAAEAAAEEIGEDEKND